ncbi:MAG: hypothetical protein M1274_13035, partial [Actinobacteria bacterium]|nr:hypothetical protein [Actinomycetota bacterium]
MRQVTFPSQLQADLLREGCLPDLLWPPEIGVDLPEPMNLTEHSLARTLTGEQADRPPPRGGFGRGRTRNRG